jgi:hypothetical protein
VPARVVPGMADITLNQEGRRHLRAMRRRAVHLSARLHGQPKGALSYDREERAALRWAIGLIEELAGVDENGEVDTSTPPVLSSDRR